MKPTLLVCDLEYAKKIKEKIIKAFEIKPEMFKDYKPTASEINERLKGVKA